ncbi:MAG: hypothetical protein ACI9R3_004402 [Verrucomicrobiales bacterium]|jgi:hypothetical protein
MVLHVSSDLNEGLLGHDTGVSLDSGKEQDVCRYHPRVDPDGCGTEGYNQQTHWERAGGVIEADCEVRDSIIPHRCKIALRASGKVRRWESMKVWKRNIATVRDWR